MTVRILWARARDDAGDVITLSDLFLFDYGAGIAPDGRFLGTQRPTGIRPRFLDRLADHGISVPPSVFGAEVADVVAALQPDRLRSRR